MFVPGQWVHVSGADHGVAVAVDHAVHGAALGHAAADDALDVVLDHEVQRALRAALDRLPALDGQRSRAWHQRQFLEGVAAVGHLWRKGVVLALVREGLLVERLEDDVHLLLEHLAVGDLVLEGRSEALDLAGVIAPAHAEGDSAAGQDVGGCKVLGQAQGIPHGGDVEAAAESQVLGQMGQVDVEHQQVGDALVPLGLEVVLGHPHGVVAVLVQSPGDGFGFLERPWTGGRCRKCDR